MYRGFRSSDLGVLGNAGIHPREHHTGVIPAVHCNPAFWCQSCKHPHTPRNPRSIPKDFTKLAFEVRSAPLRGAVLLLDPAPSSPRATVLSPNSSRSVPTQDAGCDGRAGRIGRMRAARGQPGRRLPGGGQAVPGGALQVLGTPGTGGGTQCLPAEPSRRWPRPEPAGLLPAGLNASARVRPDLGASPGRQGAGICGGTCHWDTRHPRPARHASSGQTPHLLRRNLPPPKPGAPLAVCLLLSPQQQGCHLLTSVLCAVPAVGSLRGSPQFTREKQAPRGVA